MAVLLRDIIANGLCVVNVKRSESKFLPGVGEILSLCPLLRVNAPNAKHQGRKIPSSLTTTTGRGQNGRERSRTTKKAVNLFQDLLLSLAASVAAGIQFL